MRHITELEKLFSLIAHITDHYAAQADAVIDWEHRTAVITVDEGGKTHYAATLEIDSDAIEAKARLIRHELEQMVDECELPILMEKVA
ncbi:hypothetical protein NLU14_08805 [Marinobacter sp. 71-i]|uniref:Uncharacterized protein n=1 Tax=Marinobacter iranensis TaxID=2962607 RepID=A0ABT5Y9H3_9GAMM|nr:hypothetical protein [Marinobacter iranensis]MDF0750329.1 hypothetical protein [Marinobacter iranensis]